MKIKNLIYSSVLAMIAVGCSSDEVLLTPETMEKPISFNAFTNNLTRVQNHYGSSDQPKPNQFKVWAYIDGSDPETKYIDGVVVTKEGENEGEKWTTEQQYTWPMFDLNFYAYVDDDGKANGKSVTNYKINTDVSKQLDLMYAVLPRCYEKRYNGKVNLVFRHALSQICFKARNDDPNVPYTLTEITVSGVKGAGSFTPSEKVTGVTDDEGNLGFSDNPENEVSYGTWETAGGNVSYTLSGLSDKLSQQENSWNVISGTSYAYGDYKQRTMNLIPQSGTMTLKVKFSANNTVVVKSTDIEINWRPGYRYVYNIEVKKGGNIDLVFAGVKGYDEEDADGQKIEL